jgi:uncharacterized protein (UPF0218 family)
VLAGAEMAQALFLPPLQRVLEWDLRYGQPQLGVAVLVVMASLKAVSCDVAAQQAW